MKKVIPQTEVYTCDFCQYFNENNHAKESGTFGTGGWRELNDKHHACPMCWHKLSNIFDLFSVCYEVASPIEQGKLERIYTNES